jgi:hypothetical protein
MNRCKQCGATLPEDSSVCLQCGAKTAGSREDSEDMPKKELDFLKPALVGGAVLAIPTSITAFIGAAANLPILNITCCLWLLAGGAVAVYLLNTQRPGTLTYGDGALVGLFSGIFAAILSTVIGIPLRLLQTEQLQQATEQLNQAQMPPGMKDFMLQLMTPGINVTVILIGLVTGLILNSIFATGAGALTVAILNRKKTD